MCQRVQCSECNKPSYSGCGRHVEQVLGDVPKDQRCSCREKTSHARTPQEAKPSLFDRLFGKS